MANELMRNTSATAVYRTVGAVLQSIRATYDRHSEQSEADILSSLIEPSLLVLGFVLGPWIEAHLRRALLLARGDWSVFVTRPVSAVLLGVALLLLLVVLLPRRR